MTSNPMLVRIFRSVYSVTTRSKQEIQQKLIKISLVVLKLKTTEKLFYNRAKSICHVFFTPLSFCTIIINYCFFFIIIFLCTRSITNGISIFCWFQSLPRQRSQWQCRRPVVKHSFTTIQKKKENTSRKYTHDLHAYRTTIFPTVSPRFAVDGHA